MSRLSRLIATIALAAVAAGCAIGVGNDSAPRCDRNGDEEQRIACVR